MKTIQLTVTEKEAIKLHKSNPGWRDALERQFDKKLFSQDVADRIDDWKDMMREADRPDVPMFADLPEDLRDHFQKYYKLVIMREAYEGRAKMNIYDKSVRRNYPYFATTCSPSDFRLYHSVCTYSGADAGSGSRLRVLSEITSGFIGKNFLEIWKKVQLK